MTVKRIAVLAIASVLWLGCSDAATGPNVSDNQQQYADLPTSLPPDVIVVIQAATQADLTSLRDAISSLANGVFHGQGNRTAMLARLDALEAEIARGNIAQAMHHLQNLRKWVDGCADAASKPARNDQITDCAAQVAIRDLLDDVVDELMDALDDMPTVVIDQAPSQADPTSATPIVFAVTFSEPVTGFDDADVDLSASTAGGTLIAVVTGSGETYSVEVSGMTSSGTVVASILAGAAIDADANPTSASTSTDNTVTYNSPPPSVTIEQSVGQPDPATGGPVSFTVTFSTAVTGFDGSDVDFTGSTAPGTLAAAVSGTGPYTVLVSGMTGNGTVVASIPAGAAMDAASQPNTASTSTDHTVTIALGSPTVTINQAPSQADPTSTAPITFVVQFSEPVTGFDASDVAFTGSTATGTLVAAVTGSGAFYSVTVTGMTGSGTVMASIPASAAMDADANPSAASTSTDNSVTWNQP